MLFFFATDRDPYGQLYALMALLGTTAILIVQALAAFVVHRVLPLPPSTGPQGAHWFTHVPGSAESAGVGMLYVVWLLILRTPASRPGRRPPTSCSRCRRGSWAITGLGGIAFALAVKQYSPRRYDLIGRVVLDVRERDSEGM